jgi:hypothetical protein
LDTESSGRKAGVEDKILAPSFTPVTEKEEILDPIEVRIRYKEFLDNPK